MEVYGLPLHPLVVHAAVVLVPLAALGALAVLVSAGLRRRYGWLVTAVAVAGAVAAIVARLSGEALAEAMGAGAAVLAHAAWGQMAPWAAAALALTLPAALWAEHRSRVAWLASAALTALSALAALALVTVTGHSGALAVWGGT